MIGPLYELRMAAVAALSARLVETPFAKFLKFRVFELLGPSGPQAVGVLNGPGHDCASVAAVVLDPDSQPFMVLKTGDARISRVMRGQPYLKLGCVAGRLDKAGASAAKIGLAELAEEVGGQVVANSFRPLGQWLSPTMPNESSEADASFFSLIRLDSGAQGDGGGMEVAGLIGPVFLTFNQGFQAMEEGTVGDAGRAQALYRRCADSIGYLPELGVWVYDQPQLLGRYRTLGLGQPIDPRGVSGTVPANFVPNGPPAAIDGAGWTERHDVTLPGYGVMVDGQTCHTAKGLPVGAKFANQLMLLDYDRAKLVRYALDENQRPWVRFGSCLRPVMAVKGLALTGEQQLDVEENVDLVRRDVDDVKIGRSASMPPGWEKLGEACGASSGQCDLYYHFYALREQAGPDWIPLGEALELCRTGQGDAQTEAALLRLARRLKWLPNLGMSLEEAVRLLASADRTRDPDAAN